MRYEPKVGDPFPLAEVTRARTRHLVEVTRSCIALGLLSVGVAALLIEGWGCLVTESCHPLQMLWSVIAAPIGGILGYYFRSPTSGNHGEQEHNESTA